MHGPNLVEEADEGVSATERCVSALGVDHHAHAESGLGFVAKRVNDLGVLQRLGGEIDRSARAADLVDEQLDEGLARAEPHAHAGHARVAGGVVDGEDEECKQPARR